MGGQARFDSAGATRYPRREPPEGRGGRRSVVPLVVGVVEAGVSDFDACLNVALLAALRSAQIAGASILFFDLREGWNGRRETRGRAPINLERAKLVSALAGADGLVLAGGSRDGVLAPALRQALDDLRKGRAGDGDVLRDKPVGCIAAAQDQRLSDWSLTSLRTAVHERGGWPTPAGVAIDLRAPPFQPVGTCTDRDVQQGLTDIGRQVVGFAQAQRASALATRYAAA